MRSSFLLNLALLSRSFCLPNYEADAKLQNVGDKVNLIENNYIPEFTDCREDDELQAQPAKFSLNEKSYIDKRRIKTDDALLKFYKRIFGEGEKKKPESIIKDQLSAKDNEILSKSWNSTVLNNGINLENFVVGKDVTIGLAFSGHGYGSVLSGVGQLISIDDRVANKSALSGILQAASYISASDTATWLLGPLLAHEFPIANELVKSQIGFDFNTNLVTPYNMDLENNKKYWDQIALQVIGKEEAGFLVSPIDVLGRALSYQLLGKGVNNQGWDHLTLSGITELNSFQDADIPYPFFLSQFSYPEKLSPPSSKFYGKKYRAEMSPYTIGSWDLGVERFLDTSRFGSRIRNKLNYLGQIEKKEVCVKNYDNLGFLMGLSASYMTPLIEPLYKSENSPVEYSGHNYYKSLFDIDIENYDGNPNHLFFDYRALDQNSKISRFNAASHFNSKTVPVSPFNVPERDVDIAFVFDNLAGWDNLPDGLGLEMAFWSEDLLSKSTRMPPFPWWHDFKNEEKGTKPLFLGCNDPNSILIIYIPNGFSFEDANVVRDRIMLSSVDKVLFSDIEYNILIEQGRSSASLDDGYFKDDEWATCVACAMMSKTLLKHGEFSSLPEKCSGCLSKYCVKPRK